MEVLKGHFEWATRCTSCCCFLQCFCFLPSSLSNMHIDTTVDAAIQTADLVVEAVVENMELKQKLFAEYDDKVIKTS